MLSTVLVVLEPALERFLVHTVPGINNFEVGLQVALIVMELVTAIAMLAQLGRGRSVFPYALTLGFFGVIHLLLGVVPGSSAFRAAAHLFATI